MKEYVKIQTLFKRDMANKGKIIETEWSLPEFGYLRDNLWLFTEKVDGTNIRLKWQKTNEKMVLSLGGRSDNAQIPTPLMDAIQAMNLIPQLQQVFPDTEVCLYGEGYGGKIQSGGNYRSDPSFVLFDVLCGDWWLQREDVIDVGNRLGLDIVPTIGQGTILDAVEMTRPGFTSKWGDFICEGIVLRPATELKTRRGDRIIAKIKHRDFTGGKL